MTKSKRKIEVVDLFCGAGGLTWGIKQAGIKVKAGIDIDDSCRYAYESNNGSKFIAADVGELKSQTVSAFFSPDSIKVLAGCAPCQPFSTLAKAPGRSREKQWGLLWEFARLVKEVAPDIVTMENVPRVHNHAPYKDFVATLKSLGYFVDAKVIGCADLGIPQSRRRFVLLASKLGPINVPQPDGARVTVRDAIGKLEKLDAGQASLTDELHRVRSLSPLNLKRIKASKPGGTWHDWPVELRSPCHLEESGASFKGVYARMHWDKPSPTITTQCCNYGTGRFGHPEQNRAISLREAAILQSFPPDYRFAAAGETLHFATIGRLIGNAVPPKLGQFIGAAIKKHVQGAMHVA